MAQKQFILSLLIVTWLAFLASCSNEPAKDFTLTDEAGYETVARLETTQGPITIRFHSERAPAHVANFVNLCGRGFYNGTYFHRVSPEFLIQGGDPNTLDDDFANDGLGGHTYAGPQTTLRMEAPDHSGYSRGDVAMARTSQVNSAGSQFFILLSERASLDGPYTVFGEVVTGIEVADRISEEPGAPIGGLGGFNPEVPQYIEECVLEELPQKVKGGLGPGGREKETMDQ